MSCHCHGTHDSTCPKENTECKESRERKRNFLFLGIGVLLLLAAFLLSYFDPSPFKEMSWSHFKDPDFFSSLTFGSFVLYSFDYLILSYTLITKMVEEIREKNYINEFTLMLVATIGAFAICEFPEAVLVVLFSIVGEMLEDYATEKSSQSIKKLVNDMPLYAHVLQEDGTFQDKNPETLPVGSILEIRPGEKIAVDGILAKGKTTLDLSSINGESLPKEAEEGDKLFSGSINLSSSILMRTEKTYQNSTLSKIMELVENEQGKKAKSEKFITRFSKFYTPLIVLVALVVFLVGYGLSGFVWKGTNGGEEWLYRALSILLISCPCALVISVPISFFAGIGSASKNGVLIKGSNYLELLANPDTVVFDKTGTLTRGIFKVSEIHLDNQEALRYAAYAESVSSHPIAAAIREAYGKEIPEQKNVDEIAGYGVKAIIDGKEVLAGSAKLVGVEPVEADGTVVYISIDRKYSGYIVISDEIKEKSFETIKELKELGINTVMLTGDSKATAGIVQEKLGVMNSFAELLPEDKVNKLEYIISKATGSVIFVGDGINDAPVLTRADVGIAMGGLGSDAAIEAADAVIMDDNPEKVLDAIKISRKTLSIVKQNIVFALGVKAIFLLLGSVGRMSMWGAVFADVGVTLLAVLNSLRTMKYRY